jgi:hypothetical protein
LAYCDDRSMAAHYLALEIAQSEAAERKSLAAIITLHKFSRLPTILSREIMVQTRNIRLF